MWPASGRGVPGPVAMLLHSPMWTNSSAIFILPYWKHTRWDCHISKWSYFSLSVYCCKSDRYNLSNSSRRREAPSLAYTNTDTHFIFLLSLKKSFLIESLIHTHGLNLTLDIIQTSLHPPDCHFSTVLILVPTLSPYVGTHCCNPSLPITNLQHKDEPTHHLYLTLNCDLHLDAVWIISSLITPLHPHLDIIGICVVILPFCSGWDEIDFLSL